MPFPAFFLLAAALGARESIVNRRNKADLLDTEAERQTAINAIDLGIDTQSIANNFDQQQVDVMQKQFQTAQGLLRSQDPKLQALGSNMLADLDSAVRANIQQNENEARANIIRIQDQEIASAGIGRGVNEKRFERELTMNKQLNDELKSYQNARVSFDKVMNLLDNDDQLASLAGLTAFVQAIDNSVVREGELLKYQGANGFITQIVNAVNKLEGRDFDPATKTSVRNASAALLNAEKTRAISITNSFQDRAVSFGLSAERVMSGVDENMFTPIPIDREAQELLQAKADEAESRLDQMEAVKPSLRSRMVAPFIDGMRIMTGEVSRQLRGSKLLRDNKGELFEQAADGTLTNVGRDDRFVTEDGRTLKLVDRGGGRYEWVMDIPTPQTGPPTQAEKDRDKILRSVGRARTLEPR